jgi:hypothetical protein
MPQPHRSTRTHETFGGGLTGLGFRAKGTAGRS